MTCPDCPGCWVVYMGRYCQIEPALNAEGEVTTNLVARSSAWKRQPQQITEAIQAEEQQRRSPTDM